MCLHHTVRTGAKLCLVDTYAWWCIWTRNKDCSLGFVPWYELMAQKGRMGGCFSYWKPLHNCPHLPHRSSHQDSWSPITPPNLPRPFQWPLEVTPLSTCFWGSFHSSLLPSPHSLFLENPSPWEGRQRACISTHSLPPSQCERNLTLARILSVALSQPHILPLSSHSFLPPFAAIWLPAHYHTGTLAKVGH